MSKNVFLNGPINYFKLTNGHKTIYIFLDVHEDITIQRKCEETYSIDIDKYIFEILKNNENIDFFLEIFPKNLKENFSKINYKYILELRKKFKTMYEKLKTENKKSVRLHYIDIRDFMLFNYIWESLMVIFNNFKSIDTYNLEKLINELQIIKSDINFIKDFFQMIKENKKIDYNEKIDLIEQKPINPNSNINPALVRNLLAYQIIEKILKKYKNQENESKINYLINEFFIKPISEISENKINNLINKLQQIKSLSEFYENNDKKSVEEDDYIIKYKSIVYGKIPYSKKIYDEIINEIEKMYLLLLNSYSVLMDGYFLRRFLDKDYIRNAIVYTGAAHSIIYIWFLIKFFNFKIVEYDTINNISQEELTKIIKKSESFQDIKEYIYPENFKQCVNLKKELNFNKKYKN